MSDPQIAALRAQLANFPRSDDYRQMRKDFDALGLGFGRAPPISRSRRQQPTACRQNEIGRAHV